MDIATFFDSRNKYGTIEINNMWFELLDEHGYEVEDAEKHIDKINAIRIISCSKRADINDAFVNEIAAMFGKVYTVNGKNLIYLEGSSPNREVYILSSTLAEKDYRSIFQNEIEAFGERIVQRDLGRPVVLYRWETREVS